MESTNLIYHEVQPIDRKEAERIFASGTEREICHALLGLAYYESDREWVEEVCVSYLDNQSKTLRAIAATSLGHIARIHGALDLDRVLPLLNSLASDRDIGGTVQDSLADIHWYINGTDIDNA